MDLSAHVGAGTKVVLGGEEYVLGPIGLAELGELQSYFVRKPLEDAIKASEGMDESVRELMVSKAWDEYHRLRAQPADMESSFEAMSNVDGLRYLVYLGLKKNHPDMTEESAARLVTLDNIDQITKMLDTASGLDDSENPTTTGGGQKKGGP